MTPLAAVDVAACVVRDAAGRVLLAERTARQISAGYWELPGGKIDPGETPRDAAARELFEEVGIRARALRPWSTYDYRFPLKRVRLRFFRVDAWDGTPHGREGQRLAWVDPEHPHVAPLLPSNDRVLSALGLSPRLVAVDGDFERLPQLFASGVRTAVVRAPRLAPDQRAAFARKVAETARRHGARAIVDGTALEARRAGTHDTWTPASDLHRLHERPDVRVWLVECRDAGELARAIELGADAATLGPVFSGGSAHARPLGWDGFRSLASGAPFPVYAQGGVTPDMLEAARDAGAAGLVTR